LETNNIENNEQTTELKETVIEDPKAVLSALERAKSDAKKYREQAEELQNTVNQKDEALLKYNSAILNEKINQKLLSEGIKNPDRVLKFLSTENLSVDEEFNLIGFEDNFEQLKSELPELFDAKLRVGGQADAAISASVSTRYSASEMQAMKILGKI
jgi:hypothetical protein